MDQFARKIIGFSVYPGDMNGSAICCMFNRIISMQKLPTYLSSDNDPLFQYYRWKANLRVLDVKEIKSIPYTPISHPFVERLIRSVRHELLDQTLFWNSLDLQKKLDGYQDYFNRCRSHMALVAKTPDQKANNMREKIISITNYDWQAYSNGLFQLPSVA